MRLRLVHQLSLLMLCAVMLALLLMALLMMAAAIGWNVRTGFADYLEARDAERFAPPPRRPPPPETHRWGERLAIENSEGRVLVGHSRKAELPSLTRAILVDGQNIATARLYIAAQIPAGVEARFLSRQYGALASIDSSQRGARGRQSSHAGMGHRRRRSAHPFQPPDAHAHAD